MLSVMEKRKGRERREGSRRTGFPFYNQDGMGIISKLTFEPRLEGVRKLCRRLGEECFRQS